MGQLLLIEAAGRLAAGGMPFELVLAGDGPMRADIEALIGRLGLGDRVRITGWLDAAGIARELRGARALVVPSLSEGLPVVIMEAMAHRLPVIAPYLAGIPELVDNAATGWLFPAGDTARLADAMTQCLQADAATLSAMGELAARRVRAMHDIDTEAAKLKRLFEDSAETTENRRQP
jgi:glycosyltransferase involved in cell wall biosynthesis